MTTNKRGRPPQLKFRGRLAAKKRLRLKLRQADVALQLGVSSTAVRDWECGYWRPTEAHRNAYEKLLGFDRDGLVGHD